MAVMVFPLRSHASSLCDMLIGLVQSWDFKLKLVVEFTHDCGVDLAFKQVLRWFFRVLMCAADSVSDAVFYAFADDVIHSRFHGSIVLCCGFRMALQIPVGFPLPLRLV